MTTTTRPHSATGVLCQHDRTAPQKQPVHTTAILAPILGRAIGVAVTTVLLFFGAAISIAIIGFLQEPTFLPFMVVLLLVLAYIANYPLSLFAFAMVSAPLALVCLTCAYFSLRLWKHAPQSRTS